MLQCTVYMYTNLISTPFSCSALYHVLHIFTLSLIVIPPSPRSLHVHTYTYIIPPPLQLQHTLCMYHTDRSVYTHSYIIPPLPLQCTCIHDYIYCTPPHNVHHMQGIIPTSPSPSDHCHLILKLKLRCCWCCTELVSAAAVVVAEYLQRWWCQTLL